MSEFTSGFWDLYVVVLSVVSILACGVFLKKIGRASCRERV